MVSPTIMIVVTFAIVLKYLLRLLYYKAARELTRLDYITFSPILGTFTEIIRNLPEIRSMNMQNFVFDRLMYYQNENIKNEVMTMGLDNWYDVNNGMLASFLIQIPCYAIILYQLNNNVSSLDMSMSI